ncbi:biopolymer transporter ExbD [bacterium]|nr:biopolymer transporter ExbD [bacterium]
MEFKKKSKVSTEIPTASMPDIVFMLLLFFMVSTVFRQSTGIPVDLPVARMIKKLDAKKNVTNIWADAQGNISIDDKIIEKVTDIRNIIYQKRIETPKLVVSFKFDRFTNMGLVSDIQQELRKADALKVNYCAKFGD